MESSNSFNAKQSGTSHKPFPFIYALFPKGQNTQYVVHNVRPLLQGFGVGHSFCWQGENIAIIGAYDNEVFFHSLFLHMTF
jgi:hypothetical protein